MKPDDIPGPSIPWGPGPVFAMLEGRCFCSHIIHIPPPLRTFLLLFRSSETSKAYHKEGWITYNVRVTIIKRGVIFLSFCTINPRGCRDSQKPLTADAVMWKSCGGLFKSKKNIQKRGPDIQLQKGGPDMQIQKNIQKGGPDIQIQKKTSKKSIQGHITIDLSISMDWKIRTLTFPNLISVARWANQPSIGVSKTITLNLKPHCIHRSNGEYNYGNHGLRKGAALARCSVLGP